MSILPFRRKSKREHIVVPTKRGKGKPVPDYNKHLQDVANGLKEKNTYDPSQNAVYQDLLRKLEQIKKKR